MALLHRTFSLIGLLALVGACGQSADAASAELQAELAGVIWTVQSAEGVTDEFPFQPGVETFDVVRDDLFVGYNGCTSWNAVVEWTETSFVHPAGANADSVSVGCPEGSLSVALEVLVKGQGNVPVDVELIGDETVRLSAGDVMITAERTER